MLSPDELSTLGRIREHGPLKITDLSSNSYSERKYIKQIVNNLLEKREIIQKGNLYLVYNAQGRLFVPLLTEPFLDFKERGKQYEVRKCEKAFRDDFVYTGRNVELRKGYSGESLMGRIGSIFTGQLEDIFSKVVLKLIEPRANSVQEAIEEDRRLLGKHDKYIAFQVAINK